MAIHEECGVFGVFSSHKDLGLVGEVFSKDILSRLPAGNMAVGHVRYATTGGTTRNNCQPVEVNHMRGKMALAHNGNLSNALELRDKLELSGAIFHTTSDTETIAYVVTRERLATPCIEELVDGEYYCAACFDGNYPTKIPSDLRKDRFERKLSDSLSKR